MPATPRDLLQRLFEYIGEQLKEIDPRGFQISKQGGFLCNPEDIVGLPGTELDIRLEGDYIWLRIARLEADKPPKVSEFQKGLFKISLDPFGSSPTIIAAALLERINEATENKADNERPLIEADLRKKAEEALREYSALWHSWAEGEKPRRKTISLYGDLFALKHQMETEETSNPTELVWGVGVAAWVLSFDASQFPYTYPLITQLVEISLDEQSMALEIRPRDTETRFEMDGFIGCQVLGAADVERAGREQLTRHKDRPVTPFDPGSYSDILKLAATNLDSKGSYREVMAAHAPLAPANEHLVVTDSWVLFSRPRNNNYLIEDLKRLREKLASGCAIPVGPLAIVSPPSEDPIKFEPVNFRGISSRGDYSDGKKPAELFFPLPYNSEQVTIVKRLERAAGVTVQGPPGTGKTHTIANIICHYLATGRRVLVTSRGEPALDVLQSKIPEEVRNLTVALLTSDREGIRQFKASIEAIQHQVSQLSPEETRDQINIIQQAIDRGHRELEEIDRRFDEIAISQLSEVEVDGTPMRAQKLAELVISGSSQHSWLDDSISMSAKHAPPLTEDEATRLRHVRRILGKDIVYAESKLLSPDELSSPVEISELHNVLSQINKLDSQVKSGELLPLKGLSQEILQVARNLLHDVDQAKTLAEELEAVGAAWPLELRAKCRQSSFISERKALEALFDDLTKLVEARSQFLKRPVECSAFALTSTKVREAVSRAAITGKPFGIIGFGNGDTKKLLTTIKIAGLLPKGQDDWKHVQRFMALNEQVISFVTRWNQVASILSVPRLKGDISALRQIEITATTARKAHRLAIFFDAVLPKKAEAVFEQPPLKNFVGSSTELQEIHNQLLRHLTRSDLSRAATQLSTLQEKLAGKTGPVLDELQRFIEEDLGNAEYEASRTTAKFVELTTELRRIAGLSVELSTVRDYSKRLEEAGALKLASRIRTVPLENNGEDLVLPVSWREAWNWARIKSHLESIESRKELVSLSARRRNLEGGLARLYKDMVSKAAWLATKQNATPKVLQALAGYATAIGRIGKGTGPNAVRYRRDARESMVDAAGAIPCWIMSHAKVSESMPAEIGIFDLVIVDEASQSDLWALPAIVRGKHILVVGDDKQVSPDSGFISSEHISELKHRFLEEQPYGVEMTPEKSLYDLAARVFAAEQVMLREHFRCVSPIIAYSNRIFYKGGIQPIRIPKASERIDPPLIDIYVQGGHCDHHDRNQLEAEAIAEEIDLLLKDSRFANRTIGVVSLLGMEQAKYIDSLVRQRCSASELVRRKFECGDARTFQGSERDIIFLSLVVDPSNCKAVAGNMFDQRFNVAGSRARDRMYLVRSVLASQLSDKDLRMTLLNHFEKPLVIDEDQAENLLDRCESGFERDVYMHLIKKGYRVIPQVKTSSYRIDLVVEGTNDTRLAIECDGDEYHGPDRWQHDMNRQRVLERAGWTFWRCFASTWLLRKDEVLNELLAQLSGMGIEPLGAVEKAPTLIEKRTWHESKTNKKDTAGTVLDNAISESKKTLFS